MQLRTLAASVGGVGLQYRQIGRILRVLEAERTISSKLGRQWDSWVWWEFVVPMQETHTQYPGEGWLAHLQIPLVPLLGEDLPEIRALAFAGAFDP